MGFVYVVEIYLCVDVAVVFGFYRSSGQYLASGSTNGHVLFWDLLKEEATSEADSLRSVLAKWRIHSSAVNGCR